jgi:hypothetical protein
MSAGFHQNAIQLPEVLFYSSLACCWRHCGKIPNVDGTDIAAKQHELVTMLTKTIAFNIIVSSHCDIFKEFLRIVGGWRVLAITVFQAPAATSGTFSGSCGPTLAKVSGNSS